jgi:hypothetical protein
VEQTWSADKTTYQLNPYEDATYNVEVQAEDEDGNVQTGHRTVTITTGV